MVFLKLVSTCPEEHFQRLFLKSWNFRIFLNFVRQMFGRLVKTAFYMNLRGTLWGQIISFENFKFLIISGFWAKKTSDFNEKNSVVKTAFCVSRGTFSGKITFGKTIHFFVVFRHWAKNFRPFGAFFGMVVRTAFYVSQKTFWGIFCGRNKIIKIISDFRQ